MWLVVDPGNNVQAKVWGCYSTNETTPIPAQDWTITGDNRIALTGKGKVFCTGTYCCDTRLTGRSSSQDSAWI